MEDVYIIIPARIGSTRLPNKPLIDLNGKSLIQRVYLNASKVSPNVFVATDSKKIEQNLSKYTSKIIMTSSDHISGTDRIFEAAEKLLAKGPLFTCHCLTGCDAGLIQTVSPAVKQTVRDATHKVTEARLSALGCQLTSSIECAHDSATITAELNIMIDAGIPLILICGASAISDRRDIVPAAVTLAGGHIEQLGLAVDPGNLTMVAAIDDTMVIGMPGCARSPRLNGLDWILHLYLAGLDIDRRALASMAAGGLLMEIASRPLPRKMVERRQPDGVDIAGIVLAAGMSRRMGSVNKLLVDIDGVPMVRRTAQAMLDGGIEDLVVVTGHDADRIKAALDGLAVSFVHNPDFATGQAGSVASGIASLPPHVSGALIALGDMPYVAADLIAEMVRDHARLDDHDARISFPVHDGRRGNPVLWGCRFFEALKGLHGDIGGREILAKHAGAVNSITWRDDSIHRDIDSKDDIAV